MIFPSLKWKFKAINHHGHEIILKKIFGKVCASIHYKLSLLLYLLFSSEMITVSTYIYQSIYLWHAFSRNFNAEVLHWTEWNEVLARQCQKFSKAIWRVKSTNNGFFPCPEFLICRWGYMVSTLDTEILLKNKTKLLEHSLKVRKGQFLIIWGTVLHLFYFCLLNENLNWQ